MSGKPSTLKTADDLIDAGLVEPQARHDIDRVAQRYAVAITPHLVSLINPSDQDDPIARQFIPDIAELTRDPFESPDPIGDDVKSPVPGLVHRYHDRVLLMVASVCPVYCRFCFRREKVGPQLGEALSAAELDAALDYIRRHDEIFEVILTGGDPLILSPRRIAELTSALSDIPHVKILRWHTRVPVVAPDRVTTELIAALQSSRCAVYIGLHTNHVRELDGAAETAMNALASAGLTLVSQTVLLAGINDSADALEALFRRLLALRVKPYYLHHGDLAPGTAHFRTTLQAGILIMDTLRRRLSGLALPNYVLDIPGGFGKVPVLSHVTFHEDGRVDVKDHSGQTHRYPPPPATVHSHDNDTT